jgi:transposase InsO family protein
VIAELKLKKRRRFERKRAHNRTSVIVNQPGTVCAMDGATLKKGEDFVVYRDRGSLSVNAESCSGPLKSADTINVLTILKAKKRLPLVVCTDNGSPLCSKDVETFLSDNKVVHLKSLPHVPQHNGSAEQAVNDFKKLVKDGNAPIRACDILNKNRLREALDWMTPEQAEKSNLKLYTDEERAMFYEAVSNAKEAAVLGILSAKEKRKAERKAILQTMEEFSLIKIITRRSTPSAKPEVIT